GLATISASMPLVGDFDGDGDMEVVVLSAKTINGPGRLRLLEHDLSIGWDVDQPENSDWTSATSFDFDCDGIPEIVHRGAQFLRIFRGVDGAVLASEPCSS